MDWTASIDIYCERTSAAFWAEPANALTNISFFLAALIAWRIARREGKLDPVNFTLIFLTFSVAVGSSLFHTFAQKWAELADMIPIALFAVLYIALSVRRFFIKTWPQTALIGFAYFLFCAATLYLLGLFPAQALAWMNGSHIYIPVFGGILALGLFLQRAGHPATGMIRAAIAVFAVSLVFRTIDKTVCATFPLGTHFLWHLLNGLLVGLLLVAIIRHGRDEKPHP